ncbi:MAG: acyl-ACP thioesterase [Lawsonibacter sp.]|nr:acyl-ACP thioesterase [Lawsonibacter sp.]
MSVWYEYKTGVDSRDADGQGRCRPSALLGHLQEAATLAAQDGGFGRERLMEEYRAFWMLARMWFRLERPLRWGEELTVRTWHRGGAGAAMYRDFDLLADGRPAGEAVSLWVLADADSHRLLRLDSVPLLAGTDGGERRKGKKLFKLRAPEELEPVGRRRMRYSDTDMNGHVNNTRYADFACDAIGMEDLSEGRFVQEMQLGYLAECRVKEELVLLAGQEGQGVYVQGRDEGGRPRFEVRLIFGSAQ